jgi:hypothetical protein
MDEKLAQIYGTGQTDAGEDLQKTAAAELLVKLAAQEGIDLDKCSDDQIAAMVSELFKTAEFPPPPAGEKKETKGEESSGESSPNESKEEKKEEKKDESKEAQAKFAEADFLGRTMAHAMVQELDLIEKQAGKGDFLKMIREKAGKAGTAVAGAGKKAGGAIAGAAKKVNAGHVAAGAGGFAAGALAGGFSAKRKAEDKKKEGSALETLIEQRALDMLKTAGYVDAEGNVTAPQTEEAPAETQEKSASALDLVVEEQALKLLEANGYPVNWNK